MGTVAGLAVAIVTPSPQEKKMGNDLRNKSRGITIDLLDVGFLNRGNNMLNIKVVTWSLAIWAAFTFVFCVVYGLLTPSGVHMYALLQQILPGFESNSWRGFLVGLIQSFLLGAYSGLVYVPIYNFVHRRWVRQ